ncbi:FAD:protein FMN transferase [Yoonia sp. 2307UL14-13]|uniref:FAD:protein FMN transferase n=1 Tax=Yoonia sp. 2307UL14-13 TaxID=3126506 RepID=UPI0030B34C4E
MNITRRRFIAISACMAASPAAARTHRWQGRALGAEVGLTIHGPDDVTQRALADARAMLREIESTFSLYDPASALSQLNANGRLDRPSSWFRQLMVFADQGYRQTDGLFDPSVQPLWQALAQGQDPRVARDAVDWDRVQYDAEAITLDANQALTFNGIGQGFATDLIADRFAALGLSDALINIGEYRGLGGPWRLGLSDPTHGTLGTRTLEGKAIATSSPSALSLGDHAHILHPTAAPRWSSVSVEAETATQADCLSTGLCLAPLDLIAAVGDLPEIGRITLVDFDGNLRSL